METVTVSKDGIVKNILSLNYDEFQSIIEYINNVILKNDNPDYVFSFDYKLLRKTVSFFQFYDKNAVGFTSIEELKKAFSIADSMRSGANNMGYGIFSLLTIDTNSDSFNVFIQKNESKKSFFGIIHFISESESIKTMVGEYSDSKITIDGKSIDVSDLEVDGGTNSLWTIGNNLSLNDDGDEKNAASILKYIKNAFKFSKKEESLIGNECYEFLSLNQFNLEEELGKKYCDLIMDKKLVYGDNILVKPINILGDDLDETRRRVFDVQSILVNSRNSSSKERKYKIKEDKDDEWRKFNPSNAIGDIWETNGSGNLRNNVSHTCKVHITCMPSPQGDDKVKREELRKMRKIYVKLDGIIIFEEEFSMHAYDELRTVIELTNGKDNEVSSFISLNPNKSNSKLNHEFKERIVTLIKRMTKKDYFGPLLKKKDKKPKKADKRLIWEQHNGEVYSAKCYVTRCTKKLDVWDFTIGHNIPESKGGSSTDIKNLFPICATCNGSMGNKYSIDEWNEIYQ